MPKIKNRVGEIGYNNKGSKMEIVEYNNSQDIVVQFKECKIRCQYAPFKVGQVANPYDKTVHGEGYIGQGQYVVSLNKGKNVTHQYYTWHDMLRRCYAKEYQLKNPAYIGCTVCEEWLNFQNFAKWYDENYYKIEGVIMSLDKDILHKGNRIYSPNNCIFAPIPINTLFVKNNKRRGNTPIGVSMRGKVYNASCSNGEKRDVFLGAYETYLKAFEIYKEYKESLVKRIAEKYKTSIPQILYEAMMNYQVEITD